MVMSTKCTVVVFACQIHEKLLMMLAFVRCLSVG